MNVTIKFLSHLKDLAGTDAASIELPDSATIAVLVRLLCERFPAVCPAAERAMFMVNDRIASPETILNDGDQVLVLQVLSGG